ncbi:myomegalin-like isoform X3 [Aquarana catesbeiana]|uniref:myomegalin-like isoform X3 n=1 Tax=Aquarana catesbeiana TaxID=8400 RepID=UPI003CC9A92F
MKEICRICGRELCGNQRRWIFHTAAKLNLQVLLSHVLGKEILRDGQAEFVCSKCAFMLERFFRFDTVIARIEALSIEKLQKLISEKDRLKHCLTSLYRKNNKEDGQEAKSVHSTIKNLNRTDIQCSYSALLQEDFAYSGSEYWTELEEYGQSIQNCSHTVSTGTLPRKCHFCSSLRVADADYEAVCKVPRRIVQNIAYGHFSMGTSTLSDCEVANVNIVDRDGLDKLPSDHSVESLTETKDPVFSMQEAEEKNIGTIGNKLEVALSLAKMLYYRPVHSPRGSRIPIKNSVVLKSNNILSGCDTSLSNAVTGFLDSTVEYSKVCDDFMITDLYALWQNIYEDYIPLYSKNLVEKQSRDANQYGALLEKQVSMLQKAEMEIRTLKEKLQESQDTVELLQDAQRQLTAKNNGVQEVAQDQERMLQCLRETLHNKDQEVGELYQIIGDHEDTVAKLQDMLLKSQSEHLQFFQVMPTQMDFLDLQNTLLLTQMELQKKQMALTQKEHQLTDAKRFQQLLEVQLLEGKQQKETTWNHNQELHITLRKIQRELQEKNQHLKHVEEEKCTKLAAQEQSIQKLKETVSKKDQMLQEYMDILSYKQSMKEIPGGNEHTLEKLRQRIRDRDTALELAVESKFFALEDKENEVHKLKQIIREREQDIERLTNILCGNEETINSLDNLVKAKDLELEQISAAYKDLQWLKQETEEKYRFSLREKESIILQLQKSLQQKKKESEELTTCFLAQSDTGNAQIIEELTKCLQRKEEMLQGAVLARKQQAEDHMKEMMEMLTTAFTQSPSVHTAPICFKNLDSKENETELTESLRTDLVRAQEDLRIVLRKMREYQLEVSALQSIIMKQNEQLRDQAADIDTCTRNIQIKEDLIKLFKLFEELTTNKTRLSEVLQTEKQIYSCLIKCHTDCDSVSFSSKILNEVLTIQTLRSQLEETLMKTIEQLAALQSENIFVSGFGGSYEKESIEKYTDQIPKSSDFNADTDMFRKPIQKVMKESGHVIIPKEVISEKLQFELRDAEIIPSKIRKVKQDVCIQNGNLKVEEESAVLENEEYTKQKKVHEDRAGDSKTFSDEKKKAEIMNKDLIKQRECLHNLNLTSTTTCETRPKIKYLSDTGGHPKPDSVKRGCHRSIILDEEKNTNFKGLSASHLLIDNSVDKCNMQLQFKPENCELEDTSIASNSSVDMTEDDFLLDEVQKKSDTCQMQMDFQDQGYETCGKSENEMDRETTSPDFDEDDDLFTEDNNWSSETTSSPLGKIHFQQTNRNTDLNKSEDAIVLKQLVKTLRAQLEKSQNLIQVLQNQSYYSSHGSTLYRLADEHEGCWSDATGMNASRSLDQLAQRVFVLEMQFYQFQKDIGNDSKMSSNKEAGKYEWLIQQQSRELSFLRQRMKEGESICHILTQHQEENIKSIEEMLQTNDIDYCMGKNFRQNLTKVNQLAKKLHMKLSSSICCYSESLDTSPHPQSDTLDGTVTMENGFYVTSHFDDFHALKKHLLESKSLVEEMEKYLQSSLQIFRTEAHGKKVMECGGIKKVISTTRILQNILHDSHSLLSMFWTESLPKTQVNPLQIKEEQAMKDEILTLRNKVKEKEIMLKKVSEKLKISNLAKHSMEKLVSRQLTNTCGILKKARANLKP